MDSERSEVLYALTRGTEWIIAALAGLDEGNELETQLDEIIAKLRAIRATIEQR
jgi:hypothetical protein